MLTGPRAAVADAGEKAAGRRLRLPTTWVAWLVTTQVGLERAGQEERWAPRMGPAADAVDAADAAAAAVGFG